MIAVIANRTRYIEVRLAGTTEILRRACRTGGDRRRRPWPGPSVVYDEKCRGNPGNDPCPTEVERRDARDVDNRDFDHGRPSGRQVSGPPREVKRQPIEFSQRRVEEHILRVILGVPLPEIGERERGPSQP